MMRVTFLKMCMCLFDLTPLLLQIMSYLTVSSTEPMFLDLHELAFLLRKRSLASPKQADYVQP